jgi:hypothetical protein
VLTVLCGATLAGELIILAPGVKKFGEDPGIDSVIRQYGYRTTPEIMEFLKDSFELRNSLRCSDTHCNSFLQHSIHIAAWCSAAASTD